MRSRSAQRILMMLLIAVLIGVVAAPADAKRPRRYEDIYLVTWEICPSEAMLTIGAAGTPDGDSGPPPYTAAVLVDVDAELLSQPGSTIIAGEPTTNVAIPNIEDLPIRFFFLTDDEEVTDDDPAGKELQDGAITHQRVLRLVWSQRVDPGVVIRLGFTSNSEHKWGRFRIASCEPPPPGGGGSEGSSPGVTTPGSPLPTEEIRELSKDIRTNSDARSGPGGSRVPRAQCTIAGTPGGDRIEGTRGNDVICGFGGNDVIDGAGGLDVIDGADGDDRVNGGSGNDELLLGLRGNDRLNGNGGDDRASGGAGDDRVRGSSGKDFLGGGSGDDRLTGGKDRDRIRGGLGADRINARDRTRDTVNGGGGLDSATVDRPGGGRGVTGAPTQVDRVSGIEQLQ
jgi:hypothetical protein